MSKIIIFFMFISFSLSFVSPIFAAPLKKASLRIQWVPQAQFAGYYVALKKGFYKGAGIDLEILPGGPRISPILNVASGLETFGTAWLSSSLILTSQGAPIVNIGQMLQTSGLMLVTFKSSGIDHPSQMQNRRVGVWPSLFSIPPSILFKKFDIRPKLSSQGFSMQAFLDGKLEVASAMVYNEYHVILESGVSPEKLNTFLFRDYGLNFPEDGLYVNRSTLKKDPELCRNFVKASIKGWHYAFNHPEEALDIVMEVATHSKADTTRLHQRNMLREIKALTLYNVGMKGIGRLNPQDFQSVQKALKDIEKINKAISFEEFHQPLYQQKLK